MFFLFLLSELFYEESQRISLANHDIYQECPFAVTDDGFIGLVIDGRTKELVILNPEGALVGRFGQKGQGPGEFVSPDEIVAETGGFSVYDSGRSLFSRWSVEGKFLGEVPFKTRPYHPQCEGETLVFSVNARSKPFQSEKPSLVRLLGEEVKKVWQYQGSTYELPLLKLDGGIEMPVRTPWDPELQFTIGSNWIAVVYPLQNQIEILNFDGQPMGSIRPEFVGQEVSEDDIERFIERSFEIARPHLKANRDKLFGQSSWPEIMKLHALGDHLLVFGPRTSYGYQVQVYTLNGQKVTSRFCDGIPQILVNTTGYSFLEDADEELWLQRARFEMQP